MHSSSAFSLDQPIESSRINVQALVLLAPLLTLVLYKRVVRRKLLIRANDDTELDLWIDCHIPAHKVDVAGDSQDGEFE